MHSPLSMSIRTEPNSIQSWPSGADLALAGRLVEMEIVSYGGWDRCARIVSGQIEMIVTLEVGPRIIRLGQIGGPNEFVEYPDEMGKRGGDEYRSYGGHRLWIAPEEMPKTYFPDNAPVEYEVDGQWHVFTAPQENW